MLRRLLTVLLLSVTALSVAAPLRVCAMASSQSDCCDPTPLAPCESCKDGAHRSALPAACCTASAVVAGVTRALCREVRDEHKVAKPATLLVVAFVPPMVRADAYRDTRDARNLVDMFSGGYIYLLTARLRL